MVDGCVFAKGSAELTTACEKASPFAMHFRTFALLPSNAAGVVLAVLVFLVLTTKTNKSKF